MRPLRLELAAFGPYGGRAEVEFDRLGDLGLFVVAGPTGSGKTSIFDAMSYALFGELPGERKGFTAIRSDHAKPQTITQVCFQFLVDGRKWRVTRSPEQMRAKKRGVGTTAEKAKALLERWDGADWVPEETQSRAVAGRCQELVGLSQDQFQRVVLLPQGQFQRLLKADSKERRGLLRTLFGSGLYEKLEDELRSRAAEARGELTTLNRERDHRLANAAEALTRAFGSLGVDESGPDSEAPEREALEREAARLRSGPLAVAQADLTKAAEAKEAASKHRGAVVLVLEDLASRSELTAEALVLADQKEERARGLAVAERAVEAAPVVAHSRLVSRHRSEIADGRVGVDRLASDLGRMASELGLELEGEVGDWGEVVRLFGAAEREACTRGLAAWDAIAEARRAAEEATVRSREVSEVRERLEAERARLAERRKEATQSRSELEAWSSRVGELEAALDRARGRLKQRRTLDATREEEATAQAKRNDLADEIEAIGHQKEDLEGRIEAWDGAARRVEELRRLRSEAAGRTKEWSRLDSGLSELSDLEGSLGRERDRLDALLDAFQASAAPRLADRLVPGEPCAVCGSTDHPAPASRPEDEEDPVAPGQIMAAQESLAERVAGVGRLRSELAALTEGLGEWAVAPLADLSGASDRAQVDLDAAVAAEASLAKGRSELASLADRDRSLRADLARRDEALARLATVGATAEGALGEDIEVTGRELADRVKALAGDLARSSEASRRLGGLERILVDLDASLEQAEKSLARALGDAAKHEADEASARKRADAQRELVGEERAHFERRQSGLDALDERFRGLEGRQQELAAAETRLAVSLQTMDGLIGRTNFADEEAAAQAARPEDEVRDLTERHAAWRDRNTLIEARLAELATRNLPDQAPDLAAAQRREVEASEVHRLLATRCTESLTHLETAERSLDAARSSDEAVAETRAEAQRINTLADVCGGQSTAHDKVSLESWVLSAHLRDVVAAANLHLVPMSGGRYELAVADSPESRKRQGGLDLVVADSHTGKDRPVASLSGGETFQASLALALGLADVVTASRGGIRIDALFVDEGFGSLDAESLDQAISVLDGLRSRGSLVGIITHVDALKEALTVGIEIRVSSKGSELVQQV